MALRKPLLPACFLHWTEPGDASGEDSLRLMSWRRTLTLKGSAFQAFEHDVLPLLTGEHTTAEICEQVSHVFSAEDVVASIEMLAAQGMILEGDTTPAEAHLEPQMGWMTENAPTGRAAQDALAAAHVAVIGLGSCGAVAARSLAAAGIGTLTLLDPSDVLPTDRYFTACYAPEDTGQRRASVLASRLEENARSTNVQWHATRPEDAAALADILSGATLVLSCLESGELGLSRMVNEACRMGQTPWIAAALEGSEVVIGPGFFHAKDGPCYLCWRMREMAVAGNLQTRYAVEMHLTNLQTDLSGQRENLAASADIAGGMLAAEALTWLSGSAPPTLDGRFITLTLPGLRMEKHVVLRKPGCPACTPASAAPA